MPIGKELLDMDVLTRDVPEQMVISEQRMVDQAALERWLPGAMSRVLEAAGDAAAGTLDQPYLERDHLPREPVFIVLYEGNPNDGETAVECGTPLRAGAPAPAEAAARVIPAHREAYCRVTKSMVESGRIGEVYVAIEKWISDSGMQVAAAPRETYWTDFYAAGGDDVVFDVAFPVR
jgi:effector-binding domain-containing protein